KAPPGRRPAGHGELLALTDLPWRDVPGTDLTNHLAGPDAVAERAGPELTSAGRHPRASASRNSLLGGPGHSLRCDRTNGDLFLLGLVAVMAGTVADAGDLDRRLDDIGEDRLALQFGEREVVRDFPEYLRQRSAQRRADGSEQFRRC